VHVAKINGAREIYACATHGVLCGEAINRLRDAPIKQLVITDTIPLTPEKQLPSIKVLSVAPLLADAIKRIHFKDFKLGGRGEPARFADLLEGDVNWKALMAALVKTGYNGPISPEIGRNANKLDQLKEVSAALDKILAMA